MWKHSRNNARGFSLIELLIVGAMILVVTALALPTMLAMITNVRLRGGLTSLAGMMQNCRMSAVKYNKIKTVHFQIMANGPVAYFKDATDDDTLTPGIPQVWLGAPVTKYDEPTGAGAPPALDNSVLSYNLDLTYPTPSFNPRGLPCKYVAPNCPVNTGIGFVYYFSAGATLGGSRWGAVSVSPAGRVKTWIWNGASWSD